ncbi:MAG: alkaline phosphatase D family protein [Bacteroidetes bacterium]|nr:alkaline phosphatase D family protein [Bacteroidota bacterium]
MKNFLILICFFLVKDLYQQNNHKITLQPCLKPFYHGVASGDPMPNRVIIWTRVTPDTNQINQSILVDWKIATDTGMVNVINQGTLLTDSTKDFTVKVDATGLNPNTFYFYEFKANGKYSPRGRTKTTPVGAVDSLRFALVSCANFEAGLFNSYASLLARQDFDAVIALGDYIYEYNSGGYAPNTIVNRQWAPTNEILSIADYRMRYSSYRLDLDLQRLHQQFPFIIVYDDHEFANDSWMNGAQNHQANEGPWNARKQNAKEAFFEWLPIRKTGTIDPYQIYRTIKYGNLMDLIMLDTRIVGRDLQAGTSGATVTSPTRQLMGTTQFNWWKNKMDSSTAQWKVLGQQVMMAPLQVFGNGFNGDQWDGYPAERDRIYNHVLTNNISNMVVITGDIHSSWANDLPTASYNSSTGGGSAGVEFVTPSVTSPGLSIPLGASAIMAANGHIKYTNLTAHGYVIMDINQNRTQADWYHLTTVDNPSTAYTYATSFKVNNYQRNLNPVASASLPRQSIYYINAPLCPRPPLITVLNDMYKESVFLSVYPNPTMDYVTLQFNNSTNGKVNISVCDIAGKIVYNYSEIIEQGINKHYINSMPFNKGIYFIKIETLGNSETIKFVKQ